MSTEFWVALVGVLVAAVVMVLVVDWAEERRARRRQLELPEFRRRP